jgi:hypothetical protein
LSSRRFTCAGGLSRGEQREPRGRAAGATDGSILPVFVQRKHGSPRRAPPALGPHQLTFGGWWKGPLGAGLAGLRRSSTLRAPRLARRSGPEAADWGTTSEAGVGSPPPAGTPFGFPPPSPPGRATVAVVVPRVRAAAPAPDLTAATRSAISQRGQVGIQGGAFARVLGEGAGGGVSRPTGLEASPARSLGEGRGS